MRRVRQTSPGLSPAIFGRMFAAIALSAALHVFLIYGYSLPADRGSGGRVTIIQARLGLPPPSSSPQRRPQTPARSGVQDSSGPAAVVLSSPVPDDLAPPSAAPEPRTVTGDPEPAVAASSDATPSLNVPDPVHYPAKDLDIFPQAVKRITPIYPQAAREAQIAGSVTLLVLIDEAGRVLGTSVMDAAPDGIFELAAQQAVENALFYPAQKDGRTVRSRILVKIEFDPAVIAAAQ